MKALFLSTFAFDANVSLVKALESKCDMYFITEACHEIYNHLSKEGLNRTITKGTEVEQLTPFTTLIPLEKTYVVKGCRQISVFKKLWNSIKIDRLVKKINPDIILTDSPSLTYILSVIFNRNKTLLIVHDPFLHTGEKHRIDMILRKVFFTLIPHKILLNEAQKGEFTITFRENPKNVHSAFLSIYEYLSCFVNEEKENRSDSEFNILFFGRISPYKGIKYLLDAFIDIPTEFRKNMRLTIAGSGSFDFEPYSQYPQIEFINEFVRPEKLAGLISTSSVVVCPYTDATQSGVVMSAFAFKKPIIATNVGGLPEMVRHNQTGIIVEPKNSVELRDAILKLYHDKDMITLMAKNIEAEYVNGPKSWNQSAEDFLNAFKKVVE